jgi:hypothetical protein
MRRSTETPFWLSPYRPRTQHVHANLGELDRIPDGSVGKNLRCLGGELLLLGRIPEHRSALAERPRGREVWQLPDSASCQSGMDTIVDCYNVP